MRLTILSLMALVLPAATAAGANRNHGGNAEPTTSLIKYVDTGIGTGAHNGDFSHGRDPLGQCMPAVLEPGGMNFWTPQTEDTERHGTCPYYADKSKLQGFRNSHYINGGSTQDYGSVTILPVYGTPPAYRMDDVASPFSHANETLRPDYYAVPLFGGTIKAEMTGTSRTGIFRFTFARSGVASIIVRPNSDEHLALLHVDREKGECTGSNPVHRIYQGNGQQAGFSGHFLVQVNKPLTACHIVYDPIGANEKPRPGWQAADADRYARYACLTFRVKAGEEVLVKVASSFCDVDGARNNMACENPAWNFDAIRRRLSAIWEKRLGAVTVQHADKAALTKFYTSLYHTAFCPHTFNDADGRYPSFSGGQRMMHTSGTYYADYSLWDTFRALHPLLTILYPQQAGDMMASLLLKYEQGGWLPIFPAWNSYTSEMIGDPCASLLADAYTKGIRNFDAEQAYRALMKNAYEQPDNPSDYADGKGRRALTSYMKYGYIPLEDPVREAYHQREQVSRTLEYAYDDYCVARLAEALGHKAEARKLYARSRNYRNVFDPRIGYVQGRHADGTFADKRPDQGQSFITEGNACQYSWYVPHDVYGMMQCMGGRDAYVARLDSMFTQHRMWHGNEPSHQIGYLYNYAGMPWRTQQAVRKLMREEYGLGANGLSGNDDSGQMAAWYVFSALGFYPVCPGSAVYVIGSPSFADATLHMANGRSFRIVAHNASEQNIYIQSARLNGKKYNKSYLRHDDIARGGTIEFVMGPQPNTRWATDKSSCPPSWH